jgi:hypothetical protein
MSAPQLLQCPFCGNFPTMGHVNVAFCKTDGCIIEHRAIDLNLPEHIAAWNTRYGLQSIVDNAVLAALGAMGGGMGDVNKLRLKAFKSNSVDDLSDYFQAAAMWFQQHEYRAIDAINKAKVKP